MSDASAKQFAEAGADLSLVRVTKRFPGFTAIDDLTLEIPAGSFFALLGPSGCGKTTTLRLVAGLEEPTEGQILIGGKDVTATKAYQRPVNTVFQSYALFPHMTILENVMFGLRRRKIADAEKLARDALALVELAHVATRKPSQLSGGQQQRVALARALAIEPQVMLLDEPLSALDAKIRVELRAEIRRIQQQLQITTLYVTHDQEEAMSLSDRVVVMNKGFIEQVGPPFEIYNYPTTAFVAHFVGQLNVLPARVVDATAGRLALGEQTIVLDALPAAENGQMVTLAVRPEELELGTAEGSNNVRGAVESITFLGSIVRVRVNTGEATLNADLFNERQLVLPKAGDIVTVNFPPHSAWVLGNR